MLLEDVSRYVLREVMKPRLIGAFVATISQGIIVIGSLFNWFAG